MQKKRFYLPTKDKDLNQFQKNLVTLSTTNKTAWGIDTDALTVVTDEQTIYEPLYEKAENKTTRTKGDVLAHRAERKKYEKILINFVNAQIRFNDKMTDKDRSDVGLPPRDSEPTPRPPIELAPFVRLRAVEGGDIEVMCRNEDDQTRASMHPAADAIEIRYIMVAPGEVPPDKISQCPEMQTSKKAKFRIRTGQENEGKRFYGFFRWANLTNAQNNGPWGNAQTVIIA